MKPIKTTANSSYSRSKRRLQTRTTAKLFVYLTPEEKQTITEAADRQRLSLSGFIANAALKAATSQQPNKVRLSDVKPVPFPPGNENLSDEIDLVVYGAKR